MDKSLIGIGQGLAFAPMTSAGLAALTGASVLLAVALVLVGTLIAAQGALRE